MQINSTLSTRGGMQPFCLRFGEEVNTSLSQQLHRSTTYGTRRVGVGWDWRLHFNCAYQNIWIFGQMLGKRERCVFGIRERGKIKKNEKQKKDNGKLQFSEWSTDSSRWLSPVQQIALWATCEVSEVTCHHSSYSAMIWTNEKSCLWFLQLY